MAGMSVIASVMGVLDLGGASYMQWWETQKASYLVHKCVLLVFRTPASSTQPGFQHRVGAYAMQGVILSHLLLLFHLKLLPSIFTQLQPTGRLWCFSQIHQALSNLRIYMLTMLSVWTPPGYPQPLSHLALSYHSNSYSKVITLSITCLTINL